MTEKQTPTDPGLRKHRPGFDDTSTPTETDHRKRAPDSTTPTAGNRERVTAPARRPNASTDPRNEVLWRPATDDPDQLDTLPPPPRRMFRPE